MGEHRHEASQRDEAEPLQPTSPTISKVVIEVRGGVAVVTSQPDDIEVEIIDHDNEEDDAAR